ncbi:hypothetical protein P170DRAFT_463924 [Aspergillus steynii IBT 23096]|uniref:Lysine-specific metallo-endopeptidase domain-containing protein n=1 Tax=Aspergillus steynii IBT 23096 TaxID=1392250 RepID=A0A2I2GD92_9EURO|nr:uncharacterized protein P170DRAFT_463924 [Aspergillus steynii IBT 23096]PLB50842.1 hypothetical protein P170DRAFT_463924 [Aspergillus steynii IBT 23096]
MATSGIGRDQTCQSRLRKLLLGAVSNLKFLRRGQKHGIVRGARTWTGQHIVSQHHTLNQSAAELKMPDSTDPIEYLLSDSTVQVLRRGRDTFLAFCGTDTMEPSYTSPLYQWASNSVYCIAVKRYRCGGYGSTVRDGMASAIDLAQAGVDTMQALKDQTHTEAQMDLFEYMFSFAVKTVDGRRQIGPSDWDWINRIFDKVLKLKSFKEEKMAEDVVIYCDHSRYIEGTECNGNKNKKMACDKDISGDVEINSVFKWCKSKSGYFPVMADLGSKSLLAWPIHKIYNVTLLRTNMDAAALLDRTILHELTHAIPLLATTDTSCFLSYGWKRCVTLGKSRDSGINNADNYAYFALGARMISPTDNKPPQRPNRDGSVSLLPPDLWRSQQSHSLRARYFGRTANSSALGENASFNEAKKSLIMSP